MPELTSCYDPCFAGKQVKATMRLLLLTMATAVATCTPLSDGAGPHPDIPGGSQLGNPVIVCFGDSITTGLGVGPKEAYPYLLASELRVPVVVEGKPGATTESALAHVVDLIAYHPWLVIVELGGNDALRQVDPKRTERALQTLLTRLLEAGARVLLVEIPAPPGTAYRSIYTRLASDLDVPLLANVVPTVLADPQLTRDGLHPNAAGHREIAAALIERIRPWLVARHSLAY